MKKTGIIFSAAAGIISLIAAIIFMGNNGGADQQLFAQLTLSFSILLIVSAGMDFFLKKRFTGIISAIFLVVLAILWWPVKAYAMNISFSGEFDFFGSQLPLSQFAAVIAIVALAVQIKAVIKYKNDWKEGSSVIYPVWDNFKEKYSQIFINPFSEQTLRPTAIVVSFLAGLIIVGFSAYNMNSTLYKIEDGKVLKQIGTKCTSHEINLEKKSKRKDKVNIFTDEEGNALFSVVNGEYSENIPSEDEIKANNAKSFEVIEKIDSSRVYNFYLIGIILAIISVMISILLYFLKSRPAVIASIFMNFAQLIFWIPIKIAMGVPAASVLFVCVLLLSFYLSLKTVFKNDLVSFINKIISFIILVVLFAYRVDFGAMMERAIDWIQYRFDGTVVSTGIQSMVQGGTAFFTSVSWVVLATLVALLLIVIKKDLVLGLTSFVSLFFIEYMGIWAEAMETMSLVIFSTIFALVLGIPQGILAAFSKGFQRGITPVLDFMQTMPAFVYLIPAVAIFNLGEGPAVFATLIFSIPPCIRFTALGIRQIDPEFTEAADSFGSTKLQKLFKIQIPNALPTIMAGINQTIMLSLSMVVIASMVGTGGLGKIVFQAVNQLKLGNGFEGGIAVVIVAIILDRISQSIRKK